MSEALHRRLGKSHAMALPRLAELLFEHLTIEKRLDSTEVASAAWRDFTAGGRRDGPEFLRAHVPDDLRRTARRLEPGPPRRGRGGTSVPRSRRERVGVRANVGGRMWNRSLTLILALCFVGLARADAPRELWLYCPANLLVDENVDRLEAIWRRAAAAGYTHILLADSKFSRLEQMDDRYFKNVERVKTIAATNRLTVVPALFPVGYSNDLLFHDPNLAEGLAVKDALFVVRGNEAKVEADPPVKLDRMLFHDDSIRIDPAGVAKATPTDANARMAFGLSVKPRRCYHVSVQIRTRDFTGSPEIKALAGKRRPVAEPRREADAGLDDASRRLQLAGQRRRQPLLRRLGRRARGRCSGRIGGSRRPVW